MATSAVKKGARRQLWRSARCVAALGAMAAIPLLPGLFGGKVLLPADLLMVMQPFKQDAAAMGFQRVSNPILDATQQFWPWRKYAGQELRRGVLPLWNPYMLSGTPFVGNNQSAVFYPETWLFAMMRPERAFAWTAFLYLFASGVFMFWFLRGQGLRRRAAILGSAAWMYNGFVVGWICLPSFRSVPGWLPLLLGAQDRAIGARDGGRRAAWLAVAGLAMGIQFLAGNLHISFFLLLVFTLYALWSAVRQWRAGGRWLTPLAIAAGTGLLGGALAAIQLLPTLEFAFRSARRGISYHTILTYRLAWPQLLGGLMPNLFGNPVDYNYWGGSLGAQYRAYTETVFYTGALTVVLAAVALLRSLRRQVYFWAGLVVLAFALALGSPLDHLFYVLVPGFRQLPGINRAIVMACLAMPILAAYGAESLLRGSKAAEGAGETRSVAEGRANRRAAAKARRKSREQAGEAAGAVAGSGDRRPAASGTRILIWCAAGALTAGFLAALWAWLASAPYEGPAIVLGPYTWLQFARFAGLVAVGTALVAAGVLRRRPVYWTLAAAVVAVDMMSFAYHFFPLVSEKYCHPPSQIVSRLQDDFHAAAAKGQPFRILSPGPNPLDRMPPNVPMTFGLRDVQGSDSITYGRYMRLLKGVSSSRYGFPQPGWAAAATLLGAKYIITDLDLASRPGEPLRLVEGGECSLYEAPGAAPAAEVPAHLHLVDSDRDALVATLALAGRPAALTTAVVERGRLATAEPAGGARSQPKALTPTAARPQALAVTSPEPNHLRIEPAPATGGGGEGARLEAFPAGESVLVRQTCFPGWRAYEDGKPAPLIEGDYCMQLVPAVRAGTRRIDLVYQPTSFTLGGFLSLAALALLAALLVAGLTWRRAGPGTEPDAGRREAGA